MLRLQEGTLTVHHFYDRLCTTCAEENFAKRTELADLSGRVALLTGGRVKIGYQAGIKLLRAGARLIVTTRFPRDSAARYAREPDFAEWSDRLEIYGLDLRHTPSVEAFCKEMLATEERLDFIINNACQTVRRPPDFYEHMRETETAALSSMPAHVQRLSAGTKVRTQVMRPTRSRESRSSQAGRRRRAVFFPAGLSTRTCSSSISGDAIHGGCCWPKCRPWSCSRFISSMRSRRSSLTPGSSR